MTTDVATRPQCPKCGEYFNLRNHRGGNTPEQIWCGVWYDHPSVGLECQSNSSVLLTSPALLRQLIDQRTLA